MTIHQEPQPNAQIFPEDQGPTELLDQIAPEQAMEQRVLAEQMPSETPEATPSHGRRPLIIGGSVLAAGGLLATGIFIGRGGHESAPDKAPVASSRPDVTEAQPTTKPTSAATQSPTDIPSSSPVPSAETSTESSSPTTTDEASKPAITAPEKGSLEYYQISVDKYPTAESAIPAFGDLVQEYFTTGKYDSAKSDETTASKKAGDVMLQAIFGNALENQGSLIEGAPGKAGWKQLRTALGRFRNSIEGVDGTGGMAGPGEKMEYSWGYQVVSGSEQQVGNNTYEVKVIANQSSNISVYFPDHNFNSSTPQSIQLTQIDGKNGKVWEIAWISVL